MKAEINEDGTKTLSPELLRKMNAYWRAANYLSVGQIYLYDNPLLKIPLTLAHIKPRLLGHWGTTPGLNFIYVHLNRIIKKYNLNIINVTGPGHGGPGIVANAYLEGTYSELYPDIAQDEKGMKKLFKQFSFPGGIPSHAAPETPGSINEGGELGYCLLHAYGAVFDNPDLLVACVVGDGEAETGALAASWHSNKFLNPVHDGAVLPILHLNGYKIANPTVLARIPREELEQLFRGYGYNPYFVEGDVPEEVHEALATTLDKVVDEIKNTQKEARTNGFTKRTSAFHAYPWLIHRLTYRRTNHKNIHVRGYKGEGTTTTPFDMVVLNDLDRFHLVGDVIDRLPALGSRGAYTKQYLRDKLLEHTSYTQTHGEDMPEITNWKWNLDMPSTNAM
ncbi:MAG: hypothetical protein ABIN89_15155 [Chitinophagaceae bacterium]